MITGVPRPKPPTREEVDELRTRIRDLEVIVVHLAEKAGVKNQKGPSVH